MERQGWISNLILYRQLKFRAIISLEPNFLFKKAHSERALKVKSFSLSEVFNTFSTIKCFHQTEN